MPCPRIGQQGWGCPAFAQTLTPVDAWTRFCREAIGTRLRRDSQAAVTRLWRVDCATGRRQLRADEATKTRQARHVRVFATRLPRDAGEDRVDDRRRHASSVTELCLVGHPFTSSPRIPRQVRQSLVPGSSPPPAMPLLVADWTPEHVRGDGGWSARFEDPGFLRPLRRQTRRSRALRRATQRWPSLQACAAALLPRLAYCAANHSSNHLIVYAPCWNSASSIKARWRGIVVFIPSITNSSSARRRRAMQRSRVVP